MSGLVDTHSDLVLYNLETEQVEQLTDDAYSEIQPAWAPDGNRLVFATDRGPDTDLNALKFGSYKLAVMEVASRNIEVLEFFPGDNNLNPQFSSDGPSLYFLSNRSEEHTSELQSLMSTSYAVFCLKKKKQNTT